MNLKHTLFLSFFLVGALISNNAFSVDLPIKRDKSYISPTEVPGATTVDSNGAYSLWKERAWFIDPRKPEQYEASRIPGAINIEYDPGTPNQQLTPESLEAEVAKTDPVVFYCNAQGCDRSSWGAALAAEWGWSKVYYFREGIPGWTMAGFPVE
jgi:rhodanese-related sulfurtransferase